MSFTDVAILFIIFFCSSLRSINRKLYAVYYTQRLYIGSLLTAHIVHISFHLFTAPFIASHNTYIALNVSIPNIHDFPFLWHLLFMIAPPDQTIGGWNTKFFGWFFTMILFVGDFSRCLYIHEWIYGVYALNRDEKNFFQPKLNSSVITTLY